MEFSLKTILFRFELAQCITERLKKLQLVRNEFVRSCSSYVDVDVQLK